MTKILIKGGRVIDPANNIDGAFDVLIENDKIAAVSKAGQIKDSDCQIIDASGQVVTPGFIDLHTHLRDPGFEYKETIQTGTASAVAGGFTTLCCMANTDPVNDSFSVTDYIVRKALQEGHCRVHPIGAITKGLKGEELAPIGELKEAGCVAISDDGLTVQNAQLMRLAMDYAKSFDLPVSTHSIEANLCKTGHMNESLVSTKLGIPGVPNAAEDIIIARDIMLAELTGAHLHVGHLSTREGINLVRSAKSKGLKVTCEVTPHHFTLTDESLMGYDTNFKMCPPLRSAADVQAIKDAFKEGGVIDAIATDHAPHGIIDKEVEFDQAAFGIIGFETALPLSLRLVEEGYLDLSTMVRLLTESPAKTFSLAGGHLGAGAPADVTVFDPKEEWVLERDQVVSKSKNSPFLGKTLVGKVKKTIVNGVIRYGDAS
ncbi:MAG: dihydroorotase [Deltaproteobacteria bacterium]|nr:dihydroorotase [Deltaproteobacteria bacterium]